MGAKCYGGGASAELHTTQNHVLHDFPIFALYTEFDRSMRSWRRGNGWRWRRKSTLAHWYDVVVENEWMASCFDVMVQEVLVSKHFPETVHRDVVGVVDLVSTPMTPFLCRVNVSGANLTVRK